MKAEEFPLPPWPTNLFIGLTFLYIITVKFWGKYSPSTQKNTYLKALKRGKAALPNTQEQLDVS